MKVKDIIRGNSEWIPSLNNQKKLKPEISVLWPSYIKNQEKLEIFLKTLDSILTQTFENFEVIIVDDASPFGIENIKKHVNDPRVSFVVHKKNIGLPAISEYEAYIKSSGKFYIFAFDDFVFDKKAFEKLYNEINGSEFDFVHGHTFGLYRNSSGKVCKTDLGVHDLCPRQLSNNNYINNSSMIVTKTMIENVGLYDPNIIVSRICDWLLWRKVSIKCKYKRVKHFIGTECGASIGDSLGHTYILSHSLTVLFFNYERDTRPCVFEELDVIAPDFIIPQKLKRDFFKLSNFFRSKFWFNPNEVENYEYKDIKLVAVIGEYTASMALYFDSLRNTDKFVTYWLTPMGFFVYDLERLIIADVIVVVRDLFIFRELLSYIPRSNKKIYYYVDDNFIKMRNEFADFANYTIENVSSALTLYDGVLVSTQTLKEYYSNEKLHGNVILFPPSFDEKLINSLDKILNFENKPEVKEIRIGILGAGFRKKHFDEVLSKQLLNVKDKFKIVIYSRFPVEGFETRIVPGEACLEKFLVHWKSLNLDLIIHPRGETDNLHYKSDCILLIANYLKVLPIVFDEKAFEEVDNSVVDIIRDDKDFLKIFENNISIDNFIKNQKLNSFEKYCSSKFSNKYNVAILNDIVSELGLNKTDSEFTIWQDLWFISQKFCVQKTSVAFESLYLSYGKIKFTKMLINEILKQSLRIIRKIKQEIVDDIKRRI